MDLVASVRKEGSRGGRADFKWADVQTDQHRENYLGHSLMAPVGRWQRNRDLQWYAKPDNDADSNADNALSEADRAKVEREEEIRRIKKAEQEALSKALGYEVNPDGPLGSGRAGGEGEGTGANSVGVVRKATIGEHDLDKMARVKKEREGERRHRHRENREGREEKRHRHRHNRHRSLSRSTSRSGERERERERYRDEPRHRRRGHERESEDRYARRRSPDRDFQVHEGERRPPTNNNYRRPRESRREQSRSRNRPRRGDRDRSLSSDRGQYPDDRRRRSRSP